MTSKEALEYLTSKTFTGGNSILETEAEICENVIKQDLERLERLQQELKVCEYFERNLIQQNEKLKKALDIIKKIVSIPLEDDFAKVKIDKETKEETHYYALSIKYLIDEQEYELLKEVLGNEMV